MKLSRGLSLIKLRPTTHGFGSNIEVFIKERPSRKVRCQKKIHIFKEQRLLRTNCWTSQHAEWSLDYVTGQTWYTKNFDWNVWVSQIWSFQSTAATSLAQFLVDENTSTRSICQWNKLASGPSNCLRLGFNVNDKLSEKKVTCSEYLQIYHINSDCCEWSVIQQIFRSRIAFSCIVWHNCKFFQRFEPRNVPFAALHALTRFS